MNITFLLGNGFDLNLGLETLYPSFLNTYLTNNLQESEAITLFKDSIADDRELWSAAELAFGASTSIFTPDTKGIETFSECHFDFCKNLADYLVFEEKKFEYCFDEKRVVKTFGRLLDNIPNGFRSIPKQEIQSSLRLSPDSGIRYNFITFNYTNTIDRCIEFAKQNPDLLGKRTYNRNTYNNTFGDVLHVHGYTDRDMIFGVNDLSQIANPQLFEGQEPEYLWQIIKQSTNAMNEEEMDKKVSQVISSSHLIYIYGMSIGDTDALWWKRIADWLRSNSNFRVILHVFNMPSDDLIRTQFMLKQKEMKRNFLRFSGFADTTINQLLSQVYVTGYNLFEGLSGMTDDLKDITDDNLETKAG